MSGVQKVPFPYSFDPNSYDPNSLAGNGARISQAVSDFNLALSQGFKLEEAVGQDLLRVIEHMIRKTEEIIDKSWGLAQEPKLGTTPMALVYKPFLATIATDPVHGFIPAVEGLKAGLENLRDNIKQSISTYQNAETTVKGSMDGPR